MTIQNFAKFVDKTLVKQGREVFEKGKVSSIEELENGLWVATVTDKDSYELEVLLHKNTIKETSCSCEHKKKGVCSHMVAFFFAIDTKKQQEAIKEKKGTKGERRILSRAYLRKYLVQSWRCLSKPIWLRIKFLKVILNFIL